MHDCIAFDRDTGICKNTKKRVGSENDFLLDTVYCIHLLPLRPQTARRSRRKSSRSCRSFLSADKPVRNHFLEEDR